MKIITKCEKLSRKLFHVAPKRFKHFSFLVKRGKIISIGWNNLLKTHPIGKRLGYRFSNIHSELHCLLNSSSFKGMTMVNIRLGSDKRLLRSKPCEKCQQLLKEHQIKKVYYYDSGWYIYIPN